MKNIEIMNTILQKIKEYDRIMIFRHIRNDGDCVGATKGLKAIINLTWPEKKVYIIDWNTSAVVSQCVWDRVLLYPITDGLEIVFPASRHGSCFFRIRPL